jgi:hypothetical protein
MPWDPGHPPGSPPGGKDGAAMMQPVVEKAQAGKG